MTEALTGDADKFTFGIDRISIGDGGDAHPLGGPGSVTVVVGANNVGKSTVLEQIRDMLMNTALTRTRGPRVVTQLSPQWTGSEDDAEAWIRAHAVIDDSDGTERAHRPRLQPENIGHFRNAVQGPAPGRLINWYVDYQMVSGRIGMDPAGRLAKPGDPPVHPLQVLHVDRDKFDELARLMKLLFGFDLFLDTPKLLPSDGRTGSTGVSRRWLRPGIRTRPSLRCLSCRLKGTGSARRWAY